MGGGELLAIPSFLLFGGHGVDDLVEALVGHRDAGRVESPPDFLNESLDGIGAPAQPHMAWGMSKNLVKSSNSSPALATNLGYFRSQAVLRLARPMRAL